MNSPWTPSLSLWGLLSLASGLSLAYLPPLVDCVASALPPRLQAQENMRLYIFLLLCALFPEQSLAQRPS